MFENQKFKTAVHYVCSRCTDPSKLGATKLNKVLWYADAISYLAKGKPITGMKYKKLQHGPVPSDICWAIDSLQAEKKIMVGQSDHYGYIKKDYVSLIAPDLNDLEKDEIDLIHLVMDFVCDKNTASSISKLSHDIVWEAAAMGEEIPLQALLAAKSGEITDADKAWADDLLREKAA